MIGSVGSSWNSASSNFAQGLSAIRAQWSTSLALASLGSAGLESGGVSAYTLNPAAASMMDSLQTDLAVQTQAVIGAGYAQAKASQVDSSLGQVNQLLTTVQVDILAMADGTMTDSQKAVKKMEIESALQSIDRVGNLTSFTGQRLLDGKPITYNATTDPQNEISFTPPKVNSGSLGNDSSKLSDLSSLLDAGKYDDAMKVVQAAQSTIRNGRADGGNFSNSVEIQKDIVLDQMENTVSLYNQASAVAYGSKPRGNSLLTASLLSMNSSNTRYHIFQTLIAGLSR